MKNNLNPTLVFYLLCCIGKRKYLILNYLHQFIIIKIIRHENKDLASHVKKTSLKRELGIRKIIYFSIIEYKVLVDLIYLYMQNRILNNLYLLLCVRVYYAVESSVQANYEIELIF